MSMKDLMEDDSLDNIKPEASTTHSPSSSREMFRSMFTKGTKRFSSHFDKDAANGGNSPISGGSMNGDDAGSNNDRHKDSPPLSSSTGWIKDKVTGSLTKLATTSKNTSSSIDSVNTSYSEGPLETSEELPKISKAQSELNLKTATTSTNGSADVSTVVDGAASGGGGGGGGSKRQWLKGHLTSYLSKSKMSASVSADNIHASTSNGIHPQELNSMNVPNDHKEPDEKPIKTVPSSFNVITFDESHLPLLDPKLPPKAAQNNGNNDSVDTTSSNNQNARHNLHQKDGGGRIKTNLSLSELLQSPRSPPKQQKAEVEKQNIPVVAATPEMTGDVVVDNAAAEQELDVVVDNIVREDLKHHFKPTDSYNVTFSHLWYMSLPMFCYLQYIQYILPSYLEGVVTGALVMYVVGCALVWLFSSSAESTLQYRKDLKSFLKQEKNSDKFEIFKGLPKPESLQKPRTLKVSLFFKAIFFCRFLFF